MPLLYKHETHSNNWRDGLRHYLKEAGWPINIGTSECDQEIVGPTFHLAIFVEPYLRWILEGRKTVESRFSKRRVAPYGTVRTGDWLILKRSSGPVVGICRASNVFCDELSPKKLLRIRAQYSKSLCATDERFWEMRSDSRYVTLIHLNDVRRLTPFCCGKRDRRGWALI